MDRVIYKIQSIKRGVFVTLPITVWSPADTANSVFLCYLSEHNDIMFVLFFIIKLYTD